LPNDKKRPREVTPAPISAGEERRPTTIQSLSYSGPLPPAGMLASYETVFPGCAERIVAMAESQSAHRQAMEMKAITGKIQNERLGQIFAFILGATAIVGGIVLIAFNKNVAGLTAILAALVALAGVFMYGRSAETKERQRKRDEAAKLEGKRP